MKKHLVNAVVPRTHNDYTPSLLQQFAMGGMALMVLVSFAAVNIQALLWQGSDWLVGAVLPAVVTSLTNDERVAVAEAPLLRNSVLDEAARKKAEHMASEGYFAHYSPGGVSPWHWFEEVGYTYVHAGENLAVHFSDSDEVVEAWMDSPTHRANIVNSDYTEIGIGVAKGTYEGYDTVFVVQMFGAPGLPAPIAVAEPEPAPLMILNENVPVEEEIAFVPGEDAAVLGVDTYYEDDVALEQGMREAEGIEVVNEPVVAQVDPVPVSDYVAPASPESVNITEGTTRSPYVLEMISTSTNLVPASSSVLATTGGTTAPMMAQLATQPNSVLQIIYAVIGGLTALLLIVSIIMGWRKKTLTQVWYGVALLIGISILFYIHTLVTSGAQIV